MFIINGAPGVVGQDLATGSETGNTIVSPARMKRRLKAQRGRRRASRNQTEVRLTKTFSK